MDLEPRVLEYHGYQLCRRLRVARQRRYVMGGAPQAP